MADDNLLIANFYNAQLNGSVSSNAGGVQINWKAGPQSFIQVSKEAVSGELPWTVTVEGVNALTISKLPGIAGFGAFAPSGIPPGLGYLTSILYAVPGSVERGSAKAR